jgi:hypothetical protein
MRLHVGPAARGVALDGMGTRIRAGPVIAGVLSMRAGCHQRQRSSKNKSVHSQPPLVLLCAEYNHGESGVSNTEATRWVLIPRYRLLYVGETVAIAARGRFFRAISMQLTGHSLRQ